MSSRTAVACTFALALLGCGCAELKVHRLADQDTPLVGQVPYYLPRTAVHLSGTLVLKKCKSPSLAATFALDFEKSVTAGAVTEPDPGHRYAIDYESTRSWMKELKFSVDTYANRTLQAYTGELNDQAGSIMIGAASAVINIAVPVKIPQIAALQGDAVAWPRYCHDAVTAVLAQVQQQTNAIKAAQQARELALTQPAFSEAHLTATLAMFDQQIAVAKNKIAKLESVPPLAIPFSAKWVPGSEPPSSSYKTSLETATLVAGWLTSDGREWLAKKPVVPEETEAWERVVAPLSIEVIVDSPHASKPAALVGELGGLVVRESVPGLLRICDGNCPSTKANPSSTSGEVVARLPLSLPQLGQLLVFPQRSILFENTQLTVKMNADGSIAAAGYRSASTAAAGMAAISAAAKDQAAGIGAANAAATAGNAAALAVAQYPNLANQALLTCLENATKIRNAGGTPVNCQ